MLALHGSEESLRVLGRERTASNECLVERDAEAELVGASVGLAAPELLGGLILGRRRGPVVADAHAPIGANEYVARMKVAVHETLGVGRFETAARGGVGCDDRIFGCLGLPLRQWCPVDELHGDVRSSLEHPDVVHAHDVGMREQGDRAGLLEDCILRQEAQGHPPLEPRVVGGVEVAVAVALDRLRHEEPPYDRAFRERLRRHQLELTVSAGSDILGAMPPWRMVWPIVLLSAACAAENEGATSNGMPTTLGQGGDDTTSGTTAGTASDPPTTTGDPGSTTSSVDDSTTAAGPSFDLGNGETTDGDCVAVAEEEQTCDGIDDDCNGFIDDIDEGGDGICDCLAIGIIGTPGSLAASQFTEWLTERGSSAERIDPPVVDATVLDAYDVVILDQLTRQYTAAEALAFETWVTAGGGLMAMTGHTDNVTSAQVWPNGILGPMGLEYQGLLLSGPVTDFEVHPITTGLTSVTFLGGFEVVATVPGQSDLVASLPAGVPAAMAQERGAGKLFVWGDEWIEYDSEWSSMPEITQLWVNIFEWITPVSVCAPPPG